MDKEYRSALEPETKPLTDFHPSEHILPQITRTMLPNRDVALIFDKLNMYQDGDFFRVHKDTPSRETLVGSLVVCLPSEFTGGDLKLWRPRTSRDEDNPAARVA